MKRHSLSIVVVFCLLITAGCLPYWAPRPASTVTIPASIDQTGTTDVSAAFQAFLNSVPNRSVVALRPGARYRLEQTLHITDRRNLTIDGRGAKIFATTPGTGSRSHVRVVHSEDIVIKNLIVKGSNPNAGMSDAAYVSAKEHQHGFDIRGVERLWLDKVTVSDVYGDFVYLGKDAERPGDRRWTSDVVITNSTFTRNGRMGIAVAAARNVLIERNTLDQMRRSAFDMEAHDPGMGAENVTIRNNDVGLSRLLLVAAVGRGDVDNFTFKGNRVADILDIRLQATAGVRAANWTIVDNVAAGRSGNPNGAVMTFENLDGLEVHGNYQQVDDWRPMVGVRTKGCSGQNVSHNAFPGEN